MPPRFPATPTSASTRWSGCRWEARTPRSAYRCQCRLLPAVAYRPTLVWANRWAIPRVRGGTPHDWPVLDSRGGAALSGPLPRLVLPDDEPATFELLEPTFHRPRTPTTVVDLSVAKDVVKVLDGGSGDRVVLVVGPGVAGPPEVDALRRAGSGRSRCPRRRSRRTARRTRPSGARLDLESREGQRPEQLGLAPRRVSPGPSRGRAGCGSSRSSKPRQRVAVRRRGREVGDRSLPHGVRRVRHDAVIVRDQVEEQRGSRRQERSPRRSPISKAASMPRLRAAASGRPDGPVTDITWARRPPRTGHSTRLGSSMATTT